MRRLKDQVAKSFVGRIIFVVILAAIVWAGFKYVPGAPTEEKSYDIDDADVAVQLQKDGSLLVHESLDFDFNGSFTGAYRDIALNGTAQIKDLRVSEDGKDYKPGGNTELGSFDFPGTFGTKEFSGSSDFDGAGDTSAEDSYLRVVWHYSALDENRTFDLTYRVVGAANVHDDVVDVTWAPWGEEWNFWLDRLDTVIQSESGVAPIKTWLQPRSLGVDPEIDGNVARATVERVPAHEAVGFRAVFPRNAITSTRYANVEKGDELPGIEQEEADHDADLSSVTKLRNWVNDNVLLVSILIGLFGLIGIAILMFFARERPTETPEYLPEPPEDVPPALGYQLATEGEYDERLVLATLLDLVDRGYFEAKPAAGKDLDLMIRKAEDRPNANSLAKYEVAVMDFFDKLIGVKWVALGKMKDEVPKHSSAWRTRWENMNEKLDEAEEGELKWDRDLGKWRVALVIVVALLFIAVIVAQYSRTHLVPIPTGGLVLVVGLLVSVPSIWLKRMEAGPRLRSAQWKAFEHWTRDFPRLKDDPPATLELWRRILVYAVAFGTAERIVKSGRIPEPVVEESSTYWTSYAFYGSAFGSNFNSFGSGFSSQVAPQSSSGGSSGFSGGGGGGFSGGGGGGAW